VKRLLILVTAALLAAVLIIGSVGGCVGEVKTYQDSGQEINIDVGQEFVIALGSNDTTGYSWEASYDETMLELIGGKSTYEVEETSEDITGAGGIEYFRFKALKAGETNITLVYEQTWEGGGIGETKVFTVNIG
jgi:inhibitor of cysteine peptidase